MKKKLSVKPKATTSTKVSSKSLPKKRMKFIDRKLDNGMGKAVARRTYLRKITDEKTKRERWEKWSEVADRVSLGNTLLLNEINGTGLLKGLPSKVKENKKHQKEEREILRKHIANASLLMSGRHLQHGDETQPGRNMEVFTNCSTASASYVVFYLLMNGSGVGRAYDDDMCVVNWDNMPSVRCVISETHPDFVWGFDESVRDAEHKYGKGDNIHWFKVPDSREGWAQAVEMMETMAFEKKFKDELLILDFSDVRGKGSVIRGMQNRPASGPKPLMNAVEKVTTIKGAGMPLWKQALFIDHYFAECVLVGGARRSARIATKNWTDPEVFEFIDIKRGGFLWSANNSVTVDEKFWKQKNKHSRKVLKAIMSASYKDGTGEPGFINQHRLVQNDDGYDDYQDGKYAESAKYKPMKRTRKMLALVARNASSKLYSQIPNPCGEISLNMLGGYCVIADVVPYHAPTLDDAEEAMRAAVRALIRVNTMDCLYSREVKRTNRIGVGMTGIHEFAWNSFGFAFRDLIDEEKSKEFWLTLTRFKNAVVEEAEDYSKKIGVTVPHTNTTIKPSGTVSKLFALTEGAHLPSMREYIRWVQYRSDDPMVKKYKDKGYPVKELKSYKGSTAVGFPTQPLICRIGMNGELVTAAEATPEEQFKWLMLLEKYWIIGVDENGKVNKEDTGNQVSYTLKYDPKKVSYKEFSKMIGKYQSEIKCCSVMPQTDGTAYEYQPEQPVTSSEFMRVLDEIEKDESIAEDIDYEHLKCESGACPI
jgi:ribonucleoside-triphosphate reductase (formate)